MDISILSCSETVNENWLDSPSSVLDIYREFLHSGIRIWIFRFSSTPIKYWKFAVAICGYI